MNREIKIIGKASKSVSGDWVIVDIVLESKDDSYDEAVRLTMEKLNRLYESLGDIQVAQEEVKTARLDIQTVYESKQNALHQYEQVFAGYRCEQAVHLGFPFSVNMLRLVLQAIVQADVDAVFHIRFTLADVSMYQKELLQEATANARQQAEILASAACVKLGDVVMIHYEEITEPIIAPMRMQVENRMVIDMPSFEPEAIVLTETVHITWELK